MGKKMTSKGRKNNSTWSYGRSICCISILFFFTLLSFANVASATQVETPELPTLEYRLTGLALEVSPSALTVPRGVATQVNTSVYGAEALPADAAVRATLRGPSFPGTIEITATPGEPILLSPLSQSGTHFLEDIRLDVDPNLSLMANPPEVNINVLEELLVGDVTSRPLSLEEIRELGIQFDENSFKAFNFTMALATESRVVEIDLPVLFPTTKGKEREQPDLPPVIPIAGLSGVPELEIEGFDIRPIMLEPIKVPPPGEEIPPIPGIIVIPGNIAFLNQFFSVLLAVSNEAPDGTPLVVRDVKAEVFLPPGGDNVVGDILRDPPFSPGEPEYDNPLRIAKTAVGRENIKPVIAPGPDGEPGTADDVDSLRPLETGNSEFLVEGVKEGGHIIDIEIRGTLEGLPSGPIEVAGQARGAVVVRDPDFSLTFIHPDKVRAGELYELNVQLQNTSQVDANLVTVSLDPRNLSGARFLDPEDASQLIETIPPGDSGTVTFQLEALLTGQVIASTLEIEDQGGVVSGRRITLRGGVSEQGVPLSPDTLLLPPAVSYLRQRAKNDDLTSRAVALLGQAHSIATAPRGSLPAGVRHISSATVIQRARELSEAAVRLELSYRAGPDGTVEPLPQGLLLTLQDLFFDFLGAGSPSSGWDRLYRDSRQARLFGAALAEVVGREAETLGLADLLELQRSWADTEAYRGDHITLMTQAVGGEIPVVIEITDGRGRRLGGALDPQGGHREIPASDILGLYDGDTLSGQFAVVTKLEASPYSVTLEALHPGTFDLGIVAPGDDGELRQIIFRTLSVAAGEKLSVTINSPAVLQRGGAVVEPTLETIVSDGPPEVLGVMQNADRDVDPFGRVVAVLFDEDVEQVSAEATSSYLVNPVAIPMIPPPELLDGNDLRAAKAQFGNRVVYLLLRDPIGPFVPRTLDISGVLDLKGQVMEGVVDRPILPDPEIGLGAQLTGRVLRADGIPVPEAEIFYFCSDKDASITVKSTDAEGRYGLDFVSDEPCVEEVRLNHFQIGARDPVTGEEGSLATQVRAHGERLNLDIVLLGRGSVEGTVQDSTGGLIPGAAVRLKSAIDLSEFYSQTDQNGFYRISGVPVGPFGIEAIGPAGNTWGSGVIPRSGDVAVVDLTIFSLAESVVTGEVRLPDGTIAAGMEVFLGGGAAGSKVLLDETVFQNGTTTDAAGTFRFERVPSGSYVVRAIDKAAGLIGDALFTVTEQNGPDNPVFVQVLMAGTGSVSGTVYRREGAELIPIPGALVEGGMQLVTADDEGSYFIPAIPVGVRNLTALDRTTGAEGSAQVTILTAGQASEGIDIVVGSRGTVSGQVLNPDGQPLAGQEVRILISGGGSAGGEAVYWVRKAQTDSNGTYAFSQLTLKEYKLMAVRGKEVANGTARLSPLVVHDVVDLRLIRPSGRISGRVIDETGFAVGAKITLKAIVPNKAGILEYKEAGTTINDPDHGFTLEGVFPGPFAVTASSFFAPESATVSGSLPESNPVVEDITLVLAKNTASLHGCVLSPEGATIEPIPDGQGVPLPLSVFITSGVLRSELEGDPQNPEPAGIWVDASNGCYVSSIPLPPDGYTIQVTDERAGSPTFGLTGQASVEIEKGEDAEQDVRLLGLGSVGVEVVDSLGDSLPGVAVTVRRSTYPYDVLQGMATVPTDVSPLVFNGLTEGPVGVSAVVSTDPDIDVGGRDELRGFGGNAYGMVVRDGMRVVRLVIDAAGTVSGRFLMPDGSTPVPNAQVELRATRRPVSFYVTDSEGNFGFFGVPVGRFNLQGFDPATGRRGQADGELQVDGQQVKRDIELGPMGSVRGSVLDVSRGEPVAGAEVNLFIGGSGGAPRKTTSSTDGEFVFASVPGGSFSVTAVSQQGLSGRSEGTLEFEGEVVELEIVLEGSGSVDGTVFDALGAPAPAAQVTLIDHSGNSRSMQAGIDGAEVGRFAFETVPIGPFIVEARPPGALTPGDGGRIEGEVEWNGQVVSRDVTFQGTVAIGVAVSGEVGSAPVSVTLESHGIFGGHAVPTTVESGIFLFEGIPRAPLTVSARQVTPTGTWISASATLSEEDLPPPGERLVPDLELVLSEIGIIRGLVTDPEGALVSGARVSLVAGSLNSLALSGEDGSFEFIGVPLDVAVTMQAETGEGGLAVFLGTLDADGVLRDSSGDELDEVVLVLDVESPEVLALEPLPGAAGVSTDTSVVVTFSEPIDPATVLSCTSSSSSVLPGFRLLESTGTPPAVNDTANLCDDSNVVPIDAAVSADGTTVTLTPLRELRGLTQHTVVVRRAEIGSSGAFTGGVRDLMGKPLGEDFISTFVTRDNVSPVVLNLSPPDGGINVSEESIVRVTLSEPIAPISVNEASIAVEGISGPVQGKRDLIFGNTVVVFTPTDSLGNRAYLEANATYTVTVAGVIDPAGNVQLPEDEVQVTFRTVDTIPPTIDTVIAAAGARPGQATLVTATTSDGDVASIEFFVDGVLTAISSEPTSPGEFQATLVMPEKPVQVAARAVDSSGNVGELSAPALVELLSDNPPSVAITAPSPSTVVSPGTTVVFVVEAVDDVAVQGVRGATSGVVTSDSQESISPPTTPASASFSVDVPASAPEGTLTFAAVGSDSRGQESGAATLTLSVRDDIDPVVSIESPAAGELVIPGVELEVTISGTDGSGVAELSLVSAELGFFQSIPVSPASPSVSHTFTVSVPDPLDTATLALVARAVDRFGRESEAQLTLPVWTFDIEATAARGVETNPSVASANTGQTIQIVGQGLNSSLVVRFTTTDDGGVVGSVAVPLFAVLPDGSAGAVMVPATASTGPVGLETATGEALPGEVLLQIVPTLDSFSVPPGEQIEAGVVASISGSGFREGSTSVEFPGATPVAADDVSDGNTRLTVTIPEGVTAGELYVVTDGGASKVFPILGMFGLVSTAIEGQALDPSHPSANPGQSIMVTGDGLLPSIYAVFSSTDAAGVLTTVETQLTNVNAEGTQGSVTVPATAVTGFVWLRPDGGEPFPGTAFLQIVPTLSRLLVPAGDVVRPGVAATMLGAGFRIGATEVVFTGVQPVIPDSLTQTILTVTVPDGFTTGSVHVVTDGGSSRQLPLLGTFGLVGVAAEGVPVNSSEPSANIGQTIAVTGENLSEDLLLIFAGIDDEGVARRIETPLTDVAADGTAASVTVPPEVTSGPVRLSHPDGAPAESSVFLQVVPTLTSFAVESGEEIAPGVVATLSGSGFVEGATEADFPDAGRVSAEDVFDNGRTLTVTIPDGLASGLVTVVTQGGTSAGVQIEYNADVTPPEVVEVFPAPGSLDVPVNTAVTIFFSEPMNPESLTTVTVVLTGPEGVVEATVEPALYATSVVLRPLVDLPTSTTFTLTVTDVEDMAGNALLSPFESTFTTGSQADVVRPQVVRASPVGADVPVNSVVVVEFSDGERSDLLCAQPDDRGVRFWLFECGCYWPYGLLYASWAICSGYVP
jgi:hypothetical protein